MSQHREQPFHVTVSSLDHYRIILTFLWKLELNYPHIVEELNEIASDYTLDVEDSMICEHEISEFPLTYSAIKDCKDSLFARFVERIIDWGKRYYFLSTPMAIYTYFDPIMNEVSAWNMRTHLGTPNKAQVELSDQILRRNAIKAAEMLGLTEEWEKAEIIDTITNRAKLTLLRVPRWPATDPVSSEKYKEIFFKFIPKELPEFYRGGHDLNLLPDGTPTPSPQKPNGVSLLRTDFEEIDYDWEYHSNMYWDVRRETWGEFRERLDEQYRAYLNEYESSVKRWFQETDNNPVIFKKRNEGEHFDWFIENRYDGKSFGEIASKESTSERKISRPVFNLSKLLFIPHSTQNPGRRKWKFNGLVSSSITSDNTVRGDFL